MPPISGVNNAIKVIKSLKQQEVILPEEAELLDMLRRLRNQAAHKEEFLISRQAVEYYIESASTVVDSFTTRYPQLVDRL